VVSTCHSGNEPFYDEYKWALPHDVPGRRLNDRPKVVTQCEYSGADTNRADKKHVLYNRYSFNKDGDLISREAYMSDSLVSEARFQYGDNGMQSRTKTMKGPDSSWTSSRSLGGGRYKSISRSTLHPPKTWIVTFSNHGQECLQETYKDTLAQGKPLTTLHQYYQGTRLTRSTSVSHHGTTDVHYYYSKGDSPDSTITEESGGLSSGGGTFRAREIFHNNSSGDPVLSYSISGKDTVIQVSIQYTYDQHGNWIKRVATNLNGDSHKGILDASSYFEERAFQY
jgi:hypothetical protein